MTKLLFICHGNICRSPMAEFIMKNLVKKQGVEKDYFISSCATSSEEMWNGVGNPVYPPAKRELQKHGLSCEGKRAVQLKKGDYDNYDLLICMDSMNVRNAVRICGGDSENKISKLMDFTSRPGDVSDPWYSGDFERAFIDISEGCDALLKRLESAENG